MYGNPAPHKEAIFLKREQLEKAVKDFAENEAHGLGVEQSGWYRFTEYASENQMNMMELRAMEERIRVLEHENSMLREDDDGE